MNFSEAVSSGFANFTNFQDRSSRSAYWWWYLFTIIVAFVAGIIDSIIGTTFIFSAIAAIGLFIPSLAVFIRRLHDAGHSGWWWWIGLVPIVGFIVLLVFLVTESKPPNQWGAGPDQTALVEQEPPVAPQA